MELTYKSVGISFVYVRQSNCSCQLVSHSNSIGNASLVQKDRPQGSTPSQNLGITAL